MVAETVYVSVVIVDDVSPVPDKVCFRWVADDVRVPSMVGEKVSKGLLEVQLPLKRGYLYIYRPIVYSISLYKHIVQARSFDLLQLLQSLGLEGDLGVE